MMIEGRIFGFILILCFFIVLYFFASKGRTGSVYPLRRIPAIAAFEEGVGRCVEMGRPVHYTPGNAALTSEDGQQCVASLSMLPYITRLCVRNGANIIASIQNSQHIPIATEYIKEGFMMEGKIDEYNDDIIRYIPETGMSRNIAMMRTAEVERPGLNIMVGPFYNDAIYTAQAFVRAGSIQIGGTARASQIGILVASCDYWLIGEELFAAASYLSNDPIRGNILIGQDVLKIFSIILIVLGALLISVGNDMVLQLLKT